MTANEPAVRLPTSTKMLCTCYGVIAIAALIATWSQNLTYADRGVELLVAFVEDTKVTAAARSITADIILFFLAAAILMVIEARKHGVRFVWAYVIGGMLIAISVTFPLFLIARELRIGRGEPARLRPADTIGLGVLAVLAAAGTIWVDVL